MAGRTFKFPSPQTGTEYLVFIEPPCTDEPDAAGPFPAVLFMDGDDQFRFAVAAYRELRAANRVPPLLLAGVGYGASYTKPANKRIRDYTPTSLATEPESGGADAFLAFLTDTLWPELARRFPLRADERDRRAFARRAGRPARDEGATAVFHAAARERAVVVVGRSQSPPAARGVPPARGRSAGKTLSRRRRRGHAVDDGRSRVARGATRGELVQGAALTSTRFPARDHYDVLPDAFRAGLVALYGAGDSPDSVG